MPVAPPLRIRSFADDYDSEIGSGRISPVFRISNLRLRENSFLDRLQDGRAAGGVCAALSLPAYGPTATLVPDIVSALARHVNPVELFRSRQDAQFVLQQYEGLAHAFTCHLPMRR